VANVLASLGVIRKIKANSQDRKKGKGFEWVGAHGFDIESNPSAESDHTAGEDNINQPESKSPKHSVIVP